MTAHVRPPRPVRRLVAALAVVALGGVALGGCTAAAPSPPPPTSPRPTATAAGPCSPVTVGSTVAYSALPGGPFTQVAGEASGAVLKLPATTLGFADFTPAAGTIDGAVVGPPAAGLVGAGAGRTVLEVAAGTSTHAADVPTTFPATNQLSVLRVAGARTVLRGFTIRGTEQGHLYNGLRVGQVRGLRADDITVTGIPGNAASPPGETFGINDFRTVDSQWSHVVVDGADVGASGFGVNSSTGTTICDAVSMHNKYGMGFAFWQSSGITCVDCTATDNGRAGFNFERVTGSNVFVHANASGNAYGFRISSDQASARFRIVDPTLSNGHFVVTLPYRYNGVANRQKASDITLVVHGKVRTDLLRIQRY